MKIGIIVGSVREERKGDDVGRWVLETARQRDDAAYELIDLRDFDVPLLTTGTLPMQANREYESEEVTRWSRAVDACDGYVFVTAEYNHGLPGAFKNAVDSLGPEWVGKTVAFVSYGADGGVRSVEHWRPVLANFQMLDVRQQVALSTFDDFEESGAFTPAERREGELKVLLDQLTTLTGRLAE